VIVMEDKAPAHASGHQRAYFDVTDVQRLIWPGNSPDLNMIEICWAYLKHLTTKKGALTSRKAAEEAWTKAWEDLEQWRIQRWIERIPYHIQEVLRLQGRNEYLEGHPRTKRDKAYWAALQRERQNRIRDNVTVHRAALQQFRCSTAGLSTRYAAHYESLVGIQTTTADVEDLDGDQ